MLKHFRRTLSAILGVFVLFGVFANTLASVPLERQSADPFGQLHDNLIQESYVPYLEETERFSREDDSKDADFFGPGT